MNKLRVQRLSIEQPGTDPREARRLARRVAELLGEALVVDPASRSQRGLQTEIPLPTGLATEQLAEHIARALRARLR